MVSLFKRAVKPRTRTTVVKEVEPEFLDEFEVCIGRRNVTIVYAKSHSDAREKVMDNMRNDVTYIDSRYYTRKEPGPRSDYEVQPCGEIRVVLLRKNARRNPAFAG